LRRQYSDSLKFAPLLNAIVINIIVWKNCWRQLKQTCNEGGWDMLSASL
jgi:hypothetical protein